MKAPELIISVAQVGKTFSDKMVVTDPSAQSKNGVYTYVIDLRRFDPALGHIMVIGVRVPEEVERLRVEQRTLRNAAVAATERAEKAEAERDALREDAERYRWLRDCGDNNWSPLKNRVPGGAEKLDAVIDAALGKE